jgi:2-oxoglutarate dehydrogenase E2 component (dihydrolipoamide succinyltransferase)
MSIEILVPEMGESVLEATVTSWLKNEGDFVKVGETVVELETDKVNLEIGAKSAGVLSKIAVPEGEDVKVGDVLGLIDEQAEEPSSPAPQAQPAKTTEEQQVRTNEAEGQKPEAIEEKGGRGDGRQKQPQPTPQISPLASRIAQEKGLDLSQISGSGPKGRVVRADVERFIQERETPLTAPEPKEATYRPQPSSQTPPSRREERVRMSRRRRTIAKRLLEAHQNTAMLTTFNEIDMFAVMDLRRRRNEDFQARYGLKLGITSFFIKAVISALKAFPRLNAEIQGDEILLKSYYDIGVAIGAEDGLVVPVIRDADRLSFVEIERQINDYVARTREGNLSIEDLIGGTFTVTNGGVFGSMLSTPILNPPQVAIMGLHKIEDRPIALDGDVIIRPMMYVALSYDHRIVDGREAVQFLVHIKELVEDPEKLLLEG